MNKIKGLITFLVVIAAFASCTNMKPNVKYDPQEDAKAYCEISQKDSKAASQFWDKVDLAYSEKGMFDELAEFETIITSKSQVAAQDYPIRIVKRSSSDKEMTYYPEEDAQIYFSLMQENPEQAEKFFIRTMEAYNNDGYYEDLLDFIRMCKISEIE